MRKKNSNQLVNIIIIIGILFLIASLVLMLFKKKEIDNHIVEISYNEYSEIIKEDEYKIILLTSPTCSHCKNYKYYVNYVCDDYNITVYELSINSLSYDEYMEIHDRYTVTKNHYTDNNVPSILTPTTIITKNKEEVVSLSNDIGYSGFLDLLKKYEIIKK